MGTAQSELEGITARVGSTWYAASLPPTARPRPYTIATPTQPPRGSPCRGGPEAEGKAARSDLVLCDHSKEHFLPDLQMLEEVGLVDEKTTVIAELEVRPLLRLECLRLD